MVKVYEGKDYEYYMDGYVKNVLDKTKEVIKKDWDMIIAVDGYEGSGKSVFAMQMAKYVDEDFSVDNIVFTPSDFRKAVTEAGKYEAIVYDEAYTGLQSRASMSLLNRTLVGMLAEIRQRNLYCFIVMPTFFGLDKYVALWRSRALFHIYTGDNFERGRVAFFNKTKKKQLYVLGKKFYNYGKPKANFVARFLNHYPIDEKEYRKKKREHLTSREKIRSDAEAEREFVNAMFEWMQERDPEDKIQHRIKAQLLGMPDRTYYYRLQKWREGRN